MSAERIAHRYAKSLSDLVQERNELEQTYRDVQYIQAVLKQSREYLVMIKSPVINEDKKWKITESIVSGNVAPTTLAFLKIIITKGRERYLPEIMSAFITQYNKINDITPVKITTAIPMNEQVKNDVVGLLKQKYNLDKVQLKEIVDPAIVGGFIVEFNHQRYDASARHQLETVRKELISNNYTKAI